MREGKWDKKGAGTFHGEMGEWQKMAQAMTLMKRDTKWTERPTQCISESTLLAARRMLSQVQAFSCTIAHLSMRMSSNPQEQVVPV